MHKLIKVGGGGVVTPTSSVAGWSSAWMPAPTYTETTLNGKTDAVGLLCNILNISLNPFSCIASGAYTVNVWANSNGTGLISTQDVASNVQANWQIDYAACTHQLDSETRQAWVEIVPQSGQSLTVFRINTHHPAETNSNSSPNIIALVGVLPALTNATNMCQWASSLQTLNLNAPLLTNATGMCQLAYALQTLNLNAPALTITTTVFGSTVENTSLRSLRKIVMTGVTVGFTLQWGALQAEELNAMFTSLGTAAGAQTIDIRNQPGSLTCDTTIATAKGFDVLTA